MRKNYFAKLVRYMKNVCDIENGLNKLSDGRVNPTYNTAQVITLVLLGFLLRIKSFNELNLMIKNNEFSKLFPRGIMLPLVDAIRDTLKVIDIEGLKPIKEYITKKGNGWKGFEKRMWIKTLLVHGGKAVEAAVLEFKYVNLKKAYDRLVEVSNLYDGKNDIIRDSLIQRFEFTYELTHKTLKEFMKYLGVTLDNSFPRTIFKKAYVNNLISDELVWISLLEDRNSTSHIYNEKLADKIASRIVNKYVAAIGELVENLEKLK